MDFRMITTYRLDLTTDEFRLLSKALRGTLRTDDEKAKALALQKQLLRDKHRVLAQALGEAQLAVDNIAATEDANG